MCNSDNISMLLNEREQSCGRKLTHLPETSRVNLEESRRLFEHSRTRTTPPLQITSTSQNFTHLQGSVLSLNLTTTKNKMSAVDLRMKKENQQHFDERKENVKEVDISKTLKLKFGIEAILKQQNQSDGKESPSNSDHVSESPSPTCITSSEMDINEERYSPSHRGDEKRIGISNKYPMESHRPLHYHPYSPPNVIPKRCNSDPVCTKSNRDERTMRRKSESPKRRLYSRRSPEAFRNSPEKLQFSPFHQIRQPISGSTGAFTSFPLSKKKCHSTSFSPCDRFFPHPTLSPPLIPTPTRRTTDYPIHDSSTEESQNDPDDVFNETDRTPFIGKDLATMWRQRQLSSRGLSSLSSSPGVLTSPDYNKRGSFTYFPSMNNRSPASPPTASSPFNYQPWQALTANYHHGLQPFINPYYTPNPATAALAMAYMRASLKHVGSNGGILSENLANSSMKFPGTVQHPSNEYPGGPRKRKKWSRAVFSISQRRGLENSFQVTKYVAKPERKSLAEALGLTDAQVKIWFQNRRMKWRQEQKSSNTGNKVPLGSEGMSPTSGEETFNQE